MNVESAYSALLRRHRERQQDARLKSADETLLAFCASWRGYSEIISYLGMSRQTAEYRVKRLVKEGKLESIREKKGQPWRMRRVR